MNKTAITALCLVLFTVIICLYIWSSHNRFYIVHGDKGVAYEVDKKTGQSWMLRGGSKYLHTSDDVKRKKEKQLPLSVTGSITGNAGLNNGKFEGKLYNGSDWVITRMIINVTFFGEGGTIHKSSIVKFDNDIFDDIANEIDSNKKIVTLVPVNKESYKIKESDIDEYLDEEQNNVQEIALWSRDVSVIVTIKPLTTNNFSESITGEGNATRLQWYVKEAFGYQE